MGEDVGRYGGCFGVSRGLLEEFGPERVRDTPLSESGFTGAGIGAALGGMHPIVEVMTVNFSLLALDQIVNNAATMLHMSGGQLNVPLVIRMTTGAGRQLAAQHSHSLEGWYAHIPGLRVLAPATLADARGMLWTALQDPDPVLIFENGALYGVSGELAADAGPVEIDHAAVRRAGHRRDGRRLRRVACRARWTPPRSSPRTGSPRRWSTCARCARWTTRRSSRRSRHTHRAVVVDEGWRSGGLSAEVVARIVEGAFYELDAPVARVCGAEVPIPYAKHLEQAAVPQVDDVVRATRELMGHG